MVRLDSAVIVGDFCKHELHADREAEHGPEEHPQEAPETRARVAHRFLIAHLSPINRELLALTLAHSFILIVSISVFISLCI